MPFRCMAALWLTGLSLPMTVFPGVLEYGCWRSSPCCRRHVDAGPTSIHFLNILREKASTPSPMPHRYTHIQLRPQVSHPQASCVIAAPLPVANEHCRALADQTPREERGTLAVPVAAAAHPSHHPAGSTHLQLLQVAAAQLRLPFVSPQHHRPHPTPPLAQTASHPLPTPGPQTAGSCSSRPLDAPIPAQPTRALWAWSAPGRG